MMAGNPNWWSMNGMHPHDETHHLSYSSSAPTSSSSSSHFALYADSSSLSSQAAHSHDHQDFPVRSWSQLLMGELSGEREDQEVFCGSIFHHQKKLDNWEDQVLNLSPSFTRFAFHDVKQEVARSTAATSHQQIYQSNEFPVNSWIHPSNSFSNFSGGKPVAVDGGVRNHQPPRNRDHSSECTGTSLSPAVVVSKKARVQHSSTQPALKVRKEKLGDRITALHQIVSPFGKTDTASVLSEAIGYIRFLQAQIEALSSPYMRNQHSAVRERNSLFTEAEPQETGQVQFLNDNMGTKGKGASKASESIPVEDLRSRGLCLVPISCIQNVGNDTGADYWTPSAFGGGF